MQELYERLVVRLGIEKEELEQYRNKGYEQREINKNQNDEFSNGVKGIRNEIDN